MELEEEEDDVNFRLDAAIKAHLLTKPDTGDATTFLSSLNKGLHDCRKATDRDLSTGQRLDPGEHDSWVGALGYLALLDHIGTCFTRVDRHSAGQSHEDNPIVSALRAFSDLEGDEVTALYALRCAFAHDFSLCNAHESKPELRHCFRLLPDVDEPLVTMPKKRWDGDYSNRPPECWTSVGLTLLGDLVEDICAQLPQLHRDGKLKLKLKGGADELYHRYTVRKAVKALKNS